MTNPKKITYLFVGTIACFIVGLFFARFLLSIALVVLAILGISILVINNNYKREYYRTVILSHFGIVLLFGFSFFWSDDKITFWNNFKNILLLPFVLMSFGFINQLNKRQKQFLFIIFNLAVNFSIAYSCYFLLYDRSIAANYSKGQIVPTLIHHVGFSVLVVFNILLNLFWYWKSSSSSTIVIPENFVVERKNLSGIYLIKRFPIKLRMTIILITINIVFLHVLAVRTGLVLLYTSAIILSIVFIINKRSIKLSIVAILLLVFCSISSYYLFPSLKNKIAYAKYDWQQSNTNDIENYSDGRRILSYKTAIEIIKENKFFGVGLGDVPVEMKKVYQSKFGVNNNNSVYALPHNQYLFNSLSVGLVFSIIIFFIYILNFIYFVKSAKQYFIFYFLVLLVMLWEPFLAYQLGISVYLLSIFFVQLVSSKND